MNTSRLFILLRRSVGPRVLSRSPIFITDNQQNQKCFSFLLCRSTLSSRSRNGFDVCNCKFSSSYSTRSALTSSYDNICNLFQEIDHRLDLAERSYVNKSANDGHTEGSSYRNISTANLSSDFCRAYIALPHISVSSWRGGDSSVKNHFLDFLLKSKYGIDENGLASAINNSLHHHEQGDGGSERISYKTIQRIRQLCTPRYERIFQYILGSANQDLGVAFLVKLRQDIRDWLRLSSQRDQQSPQPDLSKLRAIERDIQTILTSLFRPGVLNLQQIIYDKTPASIIEQIAFKEAVHPLQSLNDLRTRLGPGRRCYAFFHPALPNRPLVFVHVALLQSIPESMTDLQEGTRKIVDGNHLESEATCATFYSITNSEPGLVGVDLGNHLIKSVVRVLKNEFVALDTFCTLSPIPNFWRWLQDKIERTTASDKFMDANLFTEGDLQKIENLLPSSDQAPLDSLLGYLKDPHWHNVSDETTAKLKPLLLKLAAYYLSIEKHHGRPLCPVAKFHIRNGAEMYRLNYLGDTTAKGVRSSCGIMINYRYSLEQLEENHVNYERTGEIIVRDGVSCWLSR